MAGHGRRPTMQVFIRGKHVRFGARFRRYVERRLRFALGRFSLRIERATVRVEDVNGPRGGEDKRCRIEVRLRPGGSVFVQESGSLVRAAVANATERVARAVSRVLDRRKEVRRAWALSHRGG